MAEFTLIEKTLGQVLDTTVSRFPDNMAFIFPDAEIRYTWKEFQAEVDAIAKGLMALGIKKGEKVAVWAPNVPHWVSFMFATAKIGAILMTVNTNYRSSELCYQLQQSECENLCLVENYREHDFLETLNTIVPELRIQNRGNLHCEKLPHLKRVVFFGDEEQKGMFSVAEIKELGKTVSEEEFQQRQAALSPHDTVNMQYTSGTTGFPKGVMLSHLSISNNGYHIGKNQKLTEKDTVCSPVPLFHCFGCVLGIMAFVHHGSCAVIPETFNPVQVMTAVETEKCTALYGVPSMYLAIVEHKLFKKFDYSSLRTGIMSGSVCPEPLMRRVLDEMNMHEITIPYGLTENSPVMTMTTTNETIEDRCATVGKAMPGIEVEIRDPQTNQKLPAGSHGEICCRGYSVMQGYYNNRQATDDVIDKDGWLHSGDLGVMDERGYLRITGRIKDMIVRGGENIYPREIEEFLLRMPGVRDVQVVAIPSHKYGEDVAAFILAQDGRIIKAEDVRDFCRGKIAWHKIPRHVATVESYPLTASGKIQKYKLRELAAERFAHNADAAPK